MRLRYFLVFMFLLSAVAGYAQGTNAAPTGILVYDPLFWKDRLKLDENQCRKIREINSQYYSKLLVAAGRDADHSHLRAVAAESLRQRSIEIWETFHPKQRKRWKRLWEENYTDSRSGQS